MEKTVTFFIDESKLAESGNTFEGELGWLVESGITVKSIEDSIEKSLAEKMSEKYGDVVDKLKKEGRINAIEHTIAKDLVWDMSENHSTISIENNPIEEYFEDEDAFVVRLHEAYEEIKLEYPDLEGMDEYLINDHSMNWAINYLED